MTAFIQSQALSITPLTPVHIGCSEDFEPTGYVIDDGILYYFDPLDLQLEPADADAIMKAVRKPGDAALREIQRFFHARRQAFSGMARGMVAVAPGVARQYEKRIGALAQAEDRALNQLEIERTAHHPVTGQPYLPGSSLKGAIRTAWLDALNRGAARGSEERANAVEQRLLDGKFDTDPFRLIGIGDTEAAAVLSRIVFASNHPKRRPSGTGPGAARRKSLTTRRQAVVGGQFRAFSTDLRLYPLPGVGSNASVPAATRRITSFQQLAQECNKFYLRRMRETLRLLNERELADAEWLGAFERLIDSLRPALECGEILLLRVGRHSGAESVTLDGMRNIKIMKGPGRSENSTDGATTVWLASEEEDVQSHMQPFGWMLVERTNAPPVSGLKEWCAQESKRLGIDLVAMETARTKRRTAALELRAQAHAAAALEKAKAEEEARLKAEEEEVAKNATPRQLEIIKFVKDCKAKMESSHRDPFNPGSGLYQEAAALSRRALADGSEWSDEERRELATALEDYLPQVLVGYDAKAARKKLALNVLRGLA